MQKDNGIKDPHPMNEENAELIKFRAWVLGPFETMQQQPKYKDMATDWQLEQEELFVEQELGDDMLHMFAGAAGVGHLDKHIC